MKAEPLSAAEIPAMAELLRIVAHEGRLKLIDALLAGGEKSVGELESLTGIGQPALSQQLGILRKAALVQTRRMAKQVYYRLDPAAFGPTARYLKRVAASSAKGAPAKPANASNGAAAMFARIL